MTASDGRPGANWPGPTTDIAGVVGFPVRHSLSPRLHNAAYSAMGIDWCYVAFEVPPGSLERAVAGAAALSVRGLSVTMPHKDAAARLATRHSRQVRRLGAANTLIFDKGAIRAESCDGEGLLDDLRQALGFDPSGRRCGVIGAGGAGRATVLALAEAGAREIIVVNRTAAKAWRSVALAPRLARVGRPEELRDLELIVQATPSGMTPRDGAPEASAVDQARVSEPSGGTGLSRLAGLYGSRPGATGLGQRRARADAPSEPESPAPSSVSQTESRSASQLGSSGARGPVQTDGLSHQHLSGTDEPNRPGRPDGSQAAGVTIAGVDPCWFGAGQLIVDLIYYPVLTPFLLQARSHGATVRGGLGMLVHQAARQIRLWTGMEAPLGAMWAVVGDQLLSKDQQAGLEPPVSD